MVNHALADDASHLALLRTPLGQPWSGRARYGAAMYFYQRGYLTAEALEAYRICSRLDAEDPTGLLQHTGLTREMLAHIQPPPQTEPIANRRQLHGVQDAKTGTPDTTQCP